jgi:hypothetical protein
LRVRSTGEAIDGWVFGKIDTLHPSDPVVLVDRFTWTNSRKGPGSVGRSRRGHED